MIDLVIILGFFALLYGVTVQIIKGLKVVGETIVGLFRR